MRSIFFTMLFLGPFLAFSQSNYHKGSVTINNGEVKNGYINYREWRRNPRYIEFKTSPDVKTPDKFFPEEVQFFVIDGMEKYIKYSGVVSMNRITFPDLPAGKDSSFTNDKIYLKQIIASEKVSLYTYADSVKTRYFVQEKGEQPSELLYQQYYDETGTNTRQLKPYIWQLSKLVNKYAPSNSTLHYQLQKLNYDTDIENFITDINGDKKVNKNRPSFNRFYFGAGLNISSTSFDGNADFNKADKPAYSPKLSIGVDVFNNPNVQRFAFRTDISFTYAKPTFTPANPYNALTPTNRVYTFTQYNLTITPQLIWNIYNKDAFKIYADIGFGFNFSKYTDNKVVTNGYTQTNPYILENYWSNFPVQAGVVLNKKIEIFASRASGTAFTKYLYYSIGSDVYSAGVHYLFSNK